MSFVKTVLNARLSLMTRFFIYNGTNGCEIFLGDMAIKVMLAAVASRGRAGNKHHYYDYNDITINRGPRSLVFNQSSVHR